MLAALARVRALDAIAVVTADEAARAAALAAGCEVLDDTARDGQSPAALIGVRHALAEGFSRVLLVPGDTPLLDPAEVDALLERGAGRSPGVTIVPDRHGTGTNALLLDPPDAIAPSFGPGSFERHRQAAESAGADAARGPGPVAGARRGHRRRPRPAGGGARRAGRAAAPATRAALAPHRVSA